MQPDITFFGEQLPDKFFDSLNEVDRPAVDLVIVIGTSLKVKPVSMIPDFVRAEVPQIYISREAIRDIAFDLQLLGSCDTVVAELCRAAGEGWELKHEMLHPETVKATVTPVEGLAGVSVVELPSDNGAKSSEKS
jgi:NAD+-dependent protein deacetylase SIR2